MHHRFPRPLLAAAASLLVAAAFAVDAGEPEGPRAWSAQLHLHGSFSEGFGSIDSHSWEASDVGVDVVWWSDHDFRITSRRALSAFGFEDATEPREYGEAWGTDPLDAARGRKWARGGKWLFESKENAGMGGQWSMVEDAVEGERSLSISAANTGQHLRSYLVGVASGGSGFARPLAAGVTVAIAVKPETAGPRAHPFLRFKLSEHAPRGDVGLERYSLEYVLVTRPGEPRREGATWRVELPVREGVWNRVTLPVTEDAARGFPFLVSGDDSLSRMLLGVETGEGERASAQFDDLRIHNARPGSEMYGRQRELIAEVAESYPDLVQLQGIEISQLSFHLNEFSLETRPIHYDTIGRGLAGEGATPEEVSRDLTEKIGRRVVEGIHARGGLVSYNHMFGATWSGRSAEGKRRREVLAELLDTAALGADLLEVGYLARGGHDLSDHLWVWDRLARAGLPLVGTGVSDSHGGPEGRWRTAPNNFVSWIYASEPSAPHLIDGLRAGRVFFGDLTRFDGRADLSTERGFEMGQVVWTDRESALVDLLVEGAGRKDELHVIRSGERIATERPSTRGEIRARVELALSPTANTTCRFEVEGRDGPKVFSNAITFVRGRLARPVVGVRVGLDLGGFFAARLAGLDLEEARVAEGELVLRGEGRGGPVRIDCAGLSAAPTVELEGITGSARVENTQVVLSDLSGRGEIRIRRAR